MEKELLAEDFARNLLSWRNSGFSIDNSVRLTDAKSKESLAEYIARPPLLLKKIRYEPFKGKVLFHTKYSDYFKENVHLFDALDFWAEFDVTKVYEIDPLVCPMCGWEMHVIAVIQDPVEIREILAHLVKTGRAPPGFDPALLN